MKKTLTLHVVILLKSSVNKDQNRYYYCNIFQEKYLYQLAKKVTTTFFFDSMFGFGKMEIVKEKSYASKKTINIWDINIGNIVISKLIKTKTVYKYLIGYLDKSIRPLVLILPKMSGYIKPFKDKDKNNKLMYF